MPCGWHCGAQLSAREMRRHFTECSCRPKPRRWTARVRCECCRTHFRTPLDAPVSFCNRMSFRQVFDVPTAYGVPRPNFGGRPVGASNTHPRGRGQSRSDQIRRSPAIRQRSRAGICRDREARSHRAPAGPRRSPPPCCDFAVPRRATSSVMRLP
jgi:hypothetical protein